MKILCFTKAYIQSMRLYYAFITGIAGWVGVAYYEYHMKSPLETVAFHKKMIVLALLFLSWGINQIVNDYLGIAEDRINAPERPMVTGELDPKKAMIVSGGLLLFSFLVLWIFLHPSAVVPAVLGVLLNILYEYAKGHGVLGNMVFGGMIAMCPVVGYLAVGGWQALEFTSSGIALFVLISIMNGLMTFYTFFKDVKGDRAAGKQTLVVKYGIERSKQMALAAAFLPGLAFVTFYKMGLLDVQVNYTFVFLGMLTLFLQGWTGILYYKYPSGEKTYSSLSTNFRACACGQAAMIGLFNPQLGMMLFIITYILIGLLFDLHANSQA